MAGRARDAGAIADKSASLHAPPSAVAAAPDKVSHTPITTAHPVELKAVRSELTTAVPIPAFWVAGGPGYESLSLSASKLRLAARTQEEKQRGFGLLASDPLGTAEQLKAQWPLRSVSGPHAYAGVYVVTLVLGGEGILHRDSKVHRGAAALVAPGGAVCAHAGKGLYLEHLPACDEASCPEEGLHCLRFLLHETRKDRLSAPTVQLLAEEDVPVEESRGATVRSFLTPQMLPPSLRGTVCLGVTLPLGAAFDQSFVGEHEVCLDRPSSKEGPRHAKLQLANVTVHVERGTVAVNVYDAQGQSTALRHSAGDTVILRACAAIELVGADMRNDSVAYLLAGRPLREPEFWEGERFCMSTPQDLRQCLLACQVSGGIAPSNVEWRD